MPQVISRPQTWTSQTTAATGVVSNPFKYRKLKNEAGRRAGEAREERAMMTSRRTTSRRSV
jgi:hypothetical protein